MICQLEMLDLHLFFLAFAGFGVAAYIFLWILLPKDEHQT